MLAPFKNLSGPVRDNMTFLPLLVEPLKKPIWTFGFSIKSCWDLVKTYLDQFRILGDLKPSVLDPFKNQFGPVGDNIIFLQILAEPLEIPI